MDESSAEAIAEILGGSTWNSGGGLWLVVLKRADGRAVAISDEAVNLFDNEDELQGGGQPIENIVLV
jgi:hypothetical protein